MDELRRLEHLSLVSKVCTELDNHYSMNDKDLAEFIIDLAEKHPAPEDFKRALAENGAEFAESFVDNLLRIIKHMMPQKRDSKVCRVLLPMFLGSMSAFYLLALPGSEFSLLKKDKNFLAKQS
jgi:ATP-dependent RNA helicase DHX8/PRP22